MCFGGSRSSYPTYRAIADKYTSFGQVQKALRENGLESCNLIFGLDFTRSNEYTGERSFGGRCLHTISPEQLNPYQEVVQLLGETLGMLSAVLLAFRLSP